VDIIAHRGAPRQHAENSLPGFRQALAWGVAGIELDVWRTRDGVIVVHHDPATHGQPLISSLPADALVPQIPTLETVLATVGGRTTVYVEIKQPGIEDDVLAVIARSPTPCAVHAFDHRVAARVTARQAGVPAGVLVVGYLIDPAGALRAAHARDWWQAWEFIDRPLVERIHESGGRVIAWTVNDPSAARALGAMGVDGICTDVADLLLSDA
jgi:glycerophosphoryl diester phosphodiesterase